jgi:hypothetical protein
MIPAGNEHDEPDDRPIARVSPPVPATYLAGAPSLSSETLACIRGQKRLMKPLDARITAEIYTLAAELRFRREDWADSQGVEIEPHTGSDRTTCPLGVF